MVFDLFRPFTPPPSSPCERLRSAPIPEVVLQPRTCVAVNFWATSITAGQDGGGRRRPVSGGAIRLVPSAAANIRARRGVIRGSAALKFGGDGEVAARTFAQIAGNLNPRPTGGRGRDVESHLPFFPFSPFFLQMCQILIETIVFIKIFRLLKSLDRDINTKLSRHFGTFILHPTCK